MKKCRGVALLLLLTPPAFLCAQADKPLAGLAVSRDGDALRISNRSEDPWLEMRIAVTELDKFDDASAYVCWGDRLDAEQSLTSKLDSCVNPKGKRFDSARLTPRFVSVAAHVPEHGRERSVVALR